MQAAEAYKTIGHYVNKKLIPYDYQKTLWNLVVGDEFENLIGVTLLSGTGSGKTEAILLPSLFSGKRLVMVYPTRSLVDDQIGRAQEYIKAGIAGGQFTEKTMIIDLGNRKQAHRIRKFNKERDLNVIKEKLLFWYEAKDSNGNSLLKSVTINDEKLETLAPPKIITVLESKLEIHDNFEIEVTISAHSQVKIRESTGMNTITYNGTKHYFGGDVILTTLDEFLFRFLGYGGRQNLLYPYRLIWGYRAKQDLIVAFDEAHSYEYVAYTNFFNLISSLVSNGIRSVVMSATLPDDFIRLTKRKFGFSYVKGEDFSGKKNYELSNQVERTEQILDYITKNLGKKIIVVRNTVRNAFEIFSKIAKFNEEKKRYQFKDTPVFFYHGRIFPGLRSRLYKKLKQLDEEGSPYVLITTHAIEVGCDLDSDVLITDFCNPDQLIQRAGRCARHKGSEGKICIVGEDFTEYEGFLKSADIDYEEYVKILKEGVKSKVLPQEQIRERIIRPQLEKDELSNALFNFLSAYVYDFDRNREELHESGFVITRSWTPSVRFFWLKDFGISDLKELLKENDTLTEVLENLKENKKLHGFDELSVSLELMASHKIDKKSLKDRVLVLTYSNTKNLEKEIRDGPFTYSGINPYVDDILVFYSGGEFPNINPIGAGLIGVPRIFQKSSHGIVVRLRAPPQVLLGKNRKLMLRYLVPSPGK